MLIHDSQGLGLLFCCKDQQHAADRHSCRARLTCVCTRNGPICIPLGHLTADRPPLWHRNEHDKSGARQGGPVRGRGESPPHSARATAWAAGAGARSVVPSDGKRTLRGANFGMRSALVSSTAPASTGGGGGPGAAASGQTNGRGKAHQPRAFCLAAPSGVPGRV